ncbi:hypothetical protein AURDEDRAFT_184028 [Auricularia subglabra TFB-10046 SS5]|nr:hypothetical protein AURDEDRAFT_184028 [Auricularia subglabra TFB-10046 SS5]
MRFALTSLLCAPSLLAGLASAQFTDAPGASVSWPDLEATLSADKQSACIHKCSVQVASDVTTSCVQKTQQSAAVCLCKDEPQAAEMKACFAENCPALADRCAAIISDNGSVSTFQLSPLIPVTNSTSGGHDSGNAPSNTGGADAPSISGGANGGNAPGNNGGTGDENSAVGSEHPAALALLSAAIAVVAAATRLLRAAPSPFLASIAPKPPFSLLPGLRNVTPRTTALGGFKRCYSDVESPDGRRRRNSSPKSKASTSRAGRALTPRQREKLDALCLRLDSGTPVHNAEIRSNWALLKSDPGRPRAVLRQYALEAVDDLWEDWLTSDAPPSDDDWATFSRALQQGGPYANGVRHIVEHIGADPELCAALEGDDLSRADLEKCAKTLCRHWPMLAERVGPILAYIQRARGRVPWLVPRSDRTGESDA